MASVHDNRARAGAHLPAADGLRGLLALLVLAKHFAERFGLLGLHWPSQIAVCGFFVLSGYLLTRNWDGRFGLFLIRRFVRLWPVYALTLAIGYGLANLPPEWTQFLWYPVLGPNAKPEINVPIWSLRIEAWAMLFMPFFVWATASGPWRLLAGLTGIALASAVYTKFFFGFLFLAGAAASRKEFRNRFLESACPQWIGSISYSLYLTHWLVFEFAQRCFGRIGLLGSLPLTFLIAWLVWRYVETPSIRLSRRFRARGVVVAAPGAPFPVIDAIR